MLEEAAEIVTRIVTDLYGPKAANWFMRAHGDAGLGPSRFDAHVGLTICVLAPPAAIAR